MKYFLLLILINFSIINCKSQSYEFLGSKIYGGDLGEWSRHLLKINENRLLLVGESNSDGIEGNKNVPNCDGSYLTSDLWILMVDTSFNIIWQKGYGGDSNEMYGYAINAGNGNILIACMSESDSSCARNGHLKGFQDIMLVMLDSTGALVWEKNFGTVDDCIGSKLLKLSDGNFVLLTSSSAGIGYDKTTQTHGQYDLWLVKFDNNGNIIYDKSFGGNMNEFSNSVDNQLGLCVVENGNGGLSLFCNTSSSNSFDVADTIYGFSDMWMINIDSLGNRISDFCLGGSGTEFFVDAIKTPSGYLLVGVTNSPPSGLVSQPQPVGNTSNAWIISIDSNGNKIWDNRYAGGPMIGSGLDTETALGIIPLVNNEFWITGSSSGSQGLNVTDSAYGARDAWIYRINGSGNILWDKRFGSSSFTRTSNSILMADSSIFLFCSADTGTTDVKAEHGYGKLDYYLVHFRYANSTVGLENVENISSFINLYPNPSYDKISVESTKKLDVISIDLLSVTGQVLNSNITSTTIDISGLPPAVYLCRVKTSKGDVFKRFCKL